MAKFLVYILASSIKSDSDVATLLSQSSLCVSCCRTIMKTKGNAMRMLAIANEDTLAETRKARLTPARLTRDMVRQKHRKATNAGFNPEGEVEEQRSGRSGNNARSERC